MTAAVRIFAIQGLIPAEVAGGNRLSYDSVQHLRLPPLGRDLLSCDSITTDLSEASSAPTSTRLAYIQVQDGKRVHYEVIPEGYDVTAASTASPILSGSTTLNYGPGWRLSVLEAV